MCFHVLSFVYEKTIRYAMMKIHVGSNIGRDCFVLLLFVLFSCTQPPVTDPLMAFDVAGVCDGYQRGANGNWRVYRGDFLMDSTMLFNGRKSLRLSSWKNHPGKDVMALYNSDFEKITGDTLVFKGWYRYEQADSLWVMFAVRQWDVNGVESGFAYDRKICKGNQGWASFSVKASLDKMTTRVDWIIYTEPKDLTLWVGDCRGEVDGRPLGELVKQAGDKYKAETDTSFDGGSGIELGDLTPQMTENLEVLGRVWGFLKYYHPKVAEGNYNWDYELFRILPRIAEVENKKERNRLLADWIDSYGKVTDMKEYAIADSAQYSRILDLDWIGDREWFDDALIDRLNRIRKAVRSDKFNYYVISNSYGFAREAGYSDDAWKDEGFRILSLYRIWNAVMYCYPYADMTDRPWNTLLKAYLPRFARADGKSDYEMCLLELATCINDSQGKLWYDAKGGARYLPSPSSVLLQTPAQRMMLRKSVDARLTLARNGEVVVESSRTPDLLPGDVLLSIDGKRVDEIAEEMSPYLFASNRIVLTRRILPYLLKTDNLSLAVTYRRDGKVSSKNLAVNGPDKGVFQLPAVRDRYDFASAKILYLDLFDYTSFDSISVALSGDGDTKGVILDLRKHALENPRNMEHYKQIVSYLLMPGTEEYAWYSGNCRSMPGNFIVINKPWFGVGNPACYKGKVAILVDEDTLMDREQFAMACRKIPNSRIIGSPTGGSPGGICSFSLVGNIRFAFTSIGTYYPGWLLCQRRGVRIDIPVRPSPDDIRNGRDAWVETAMRFIGE